MVPVLPLAFIRLGSAWKGSSRNLGVQAKINAFKEDELDNFFRFYLKAKFADTRDQGQRFDGEYHREMFMVDMDERLGLLHSPKPLRACTSLRRPNDANVRGSYRSTVVRLGDPLAKREKRVKSPAP